MEPCLEPSILATKRFQKNRDIVCAIQLEKMRDTDVKNFSGHNEKHLTYSSE